MVKVVEAGVIPAGKILASLWDGFACSGEVDDDAVMVAIDPGGQGEVQGVCFGETLLVVRGDGPILTVKAMWSVWELLKPMMMEVVEDNQRSGDVPVVSLVLDRVGAEIPAPIMG